MVDLCLWEDMRIWDGVDSSEDWMLLVVDIDWLGVEVLEEVDLSRLFGGEMIESFLVSQSCAWYWTLVLIRLVRKWLGWVVLALLMVTSRAVVVCWLLFSLQIERKQNQLKGKEWSKWKFLKFSFFFV